MHQIMSGDDFLPLKPFFSTRVSEKEAITLTLVLILNAYSSELQKVVLLYPGQSGTRWNTDRQCALCPCATIWLKARNPLCRKHEPIADPFLRWCVEA